MDNENKWEYDYSSEHSQTGETGYPNVGSSGMNTANTAGTYGEAAQADPPGRAEQRQRWRRGAASGRAPGIRPHRGKPQAASPKSAAGKNGNIARSAVALVLAAAMGLSAALWGPGWATQAAR